MSDRILRALMQLFAIIANADRFSESGRNIVAAFLKQQLSASYLETYLKVFDEYLLFFQGKSESGKARKRISVNSVKVLRICSDINAELDQQQKYVVLIRLIEFAYSSGDEITEQEKEFIATVADSFNISKQQFESCILFAAAANADAACDSPDFLLITDKKTKEYNHLKEIINESLNGVMWIFQIRDASILFFRYFGESQLTLNGQPVLKNTSYVFTPGSVIRGTKIDPVYFSDVARTFRETPDAAHIHLEVKDVEYFFKGGKQAIHSTSFSARSGNLVGVMGGSGAGKSTLLSILNGTYRPSSGSVTINAINVHREKKKLEGMIGYVPQDDLLMENLTVFQNLFYNSKLIFGNRSDEEITAKVDQLLQSLGLYEARDLKVGDALQNIISGGQRKRLNIALELIREPAVLFVDEPTSGLSSRDSENVMDLLKQLAINGKLVFVVIHQPSSDIFKMFDQLLILDIGGYPIYYGNPSDSLIYFKQQANYADADESECALCGNINPEEVFSIIEARLLDEFGNQTKTRKVSPQEWNAIYYNLNYNYSTSDGLNDKINGPGFNKPSRLKQLAVFIQRDVISKLRDTQYMLISFLEAPVLALILAYAIKYHEPGADYVFSKNVNLPVYIFMGVIVALFLGLTVSAEEIIRDRKILKRESFLNLSRSSYLFSKILILFSISLIQTASFVLIGNAVMEIKGMFLTYWLILFSASCFSNLMGLNISGAFDSAVTIYILIPVLIIPQMILSGVLVKFEDLNPTITTQNKVPVVGELMAARWAYEALAVHQFKDNEYEKHFFEADKAKENLFYQKDFWLSKMNSKVDRMIKKGIDKEDMLLVKNELKKESIKYSTNNKLLPDEQKVKRNDLAYIKKHLEELKSFYKRQYVDAINQRDAAYYTLTSSKEDQERMLQLEKNYTNEKLDELINLQPHPIVEFRHSLVRHYKPVYSDADVSSFIRAPFYVSRKHAFGKYYDTFWINDIVIWLMTVVLSIMLYFNLIAKLIGLVEFRKLFFGKRK